MVLSIAQIVIAILASIVLYFAYFKNSTLGKLAAFVILAAILLSHLLSGLGGLLSNIDFLSFLESIIKGISGIVIYAELGLLVILVFFSKHKSKVSLLKWSIIGYIVIKLLIEFNVF